MRFLTMEELLESLIAHEHTLKRDKEEKESSKKKKDLTLKLLIDEDDSHFDQEMVVVTGNFKRFLKKKVGSTSKREDKAKERQESKEVNKDKVQCNKCKGWKSDFPNKDKDQDTKEIFEDEDGSDECLS